MVCEGNELLRGSCQCVCLCMRVCTRACMHMLEDTVGRDWETGHVGREMEDNPLGGTFSIKYC